MSRHGPATLASIAASPAGQALLRDPKNAAARAAFERAGVDAAARPASSLSVSRRRASKGGARTELLVVEGYHAAALARGVAWMEKIATPTRNLGPANRPDKPGAHAMVYTAKPSVDCHGHTLRGAPRAILEECKGETEVNARGESEPFDRSRMKRHQRDALERAHRAGHIAVVTLVFGEGLAARLYVAPWAWVATRKTIHERELRAAGFHVTPETYLVAQVDG